MLKNLKNLIPKTFNVKAAASQVVNANFHSSQAVNKKLNFGESVAVLEEKISKISQVVNRITRLVLTIRRTMSRNSVQLFQSVMVLPEFLVFPKCKLVRWSSSPAVLEEWP
jgi:hypothetical protein